MNIFQESAHAFDRRCSGHGVVDPGTPSIGCEEPTGEKAIGTLGLISCHQLAVNNVTAYDKVDLLANLHCNKASRPDRRKAGAMNFVQTSRSLRSFLFMRRPSPHVLGLQQTPMPLERVCSRLVLTLHAGCRCKPFAAFAFRRRSGIFCRASPISFSAILSS